MKNDESDANCPAEKPMQDKVIALTTPNRVAKPFALNIRFHSFYQAKKQLLGKKVISVN
ncbi:hypothetical protein BTN50_1153 [Candidatus Enterovibrio altilux]|uniref:Uncharacterized protein n=2 Tax=Candidatus Enterovibrio altilux TaxID=1927128 RepID=A0A291B9H8_9GAMM|nr:hypothetical protein BTN50_1153 [Candidatus Enterovibrio luxaltus]